MEARAIHHLGVAVDDLDEAVGWDDEDDPVLERGGVLDDLDGQGGVTGQDLAQMTRSARVQVLGDDHRRRKIRRKAAHDPGQRLDAAGGGADDDKLRFGCRLRPHDAAF